MITFLSQTRYLRLILLLVPVLLYLNTLRNEYALDDSIVLTQNSYVKQGLKGIKDIFRTETFTGFFKQKKDLVQGGRYRPLSLATFAVEHTIYGEKPGISHLINALLYAVFCIILFDVLSLLIKNINSKADHIPIAFISALIFAVHPIHTEVVANIKGRDELLAGLFFLLSFYFVIKSQYTKSLLHPMAAGMLLFLALLSKENTIALIPLAVLYFIMKKDSIEKKPLYLVLIFLCVATMVYLAIRMKVLGGLSIEKSQELMNNPFLEAQNGERIPTILFTFLVYLKLLLIPYPLTHDYYPYHIELQDWSSPMVILSLFIHLAILFAGFYYFRKNRIIGFAIFCYFLLLMPVSNLFFDTGSFMNERFVFLASIGITMAEAYLITVVLLEKKKSPAVRYGVISVLALVVLTYSVLTIKRNTIWKDNFTLFTHDVHISSGSAKANCTAGGVLYETALKQPSETKKLEMLKESSGYLERAITIYPGYIDALLLAGNVHFELNRNMPEVFALYSAIYKKAPGYELAFQNLEKMLSVINDPRQRIRGYNIILKYRPDDFNANYNMGSTYGKTLAILDSATYYLTRAVELQPENMIANRDLGVAWAMQGEYEKSIPFFEKAIKINPLNADNYINLGITFQRLGRHNEAMSLFKKAEQLKAKSE